MFGRLSIPLTLALTLLAAMPAAVHADPLVDLDSPDYAVRLAATEALLTDESLTPDRLRGWLNSDLTLEQRHRLMSIARHVVLRELAQAMPRPDAPQQALGFELAPALTPDPTGELARIDETDPPPPAPGLARAVIVRPPNAELADLPLELVERQQQIALRIGAGGRPEAPEGMSYAALVVNTLPGMPAHGRLRPGDLVVAVNSRAVHAYVAQGRFTELVAGGAPGQPMRVDVLREGQPVTLRIPASDFSVLTHLYEGQPSRMRSPAAAGWRRFLDSLTPPAE